MLVLCSRRPYVEIIFDTAYYTLYVFFLVFQLLFIIKKIGTIRQIGYVVRNSVVCKVVFISIQSHSQSTRCSFATRVLLASILAELQNLLLLLELCIFR